MKIIFVIEIPIQSTPAFEKLWKTVICSSKSSGAHSFCARAGKKLLHSAQEEVGASKLNYTNKKFFFLRYIYKFFNQFILIQASLTYYPLLSFTINFAMKAAFITAFFALLVSFVFAQSSSTPFYVTSPIVGTSYKAGST
jgi:hypothetical protein